MPETAPRKIVIVTFWRSATGKEPVLDWIMSLNKEQRKTIGEDLKTVEFG